jgi:hypothetical protein
MSEPSQQTEPKLYQFTRGHLWGLLLSYEIWLRSHAGGGPPRTDYDAYCRWLMDSTRSFIDQVVIAEEP